MNKHNAIETALNSESLPCNPLPFLNGLEDMIRDNGSAFISSMNAKRVLWILMSQAYGQLSVIDMQAEWDKLNTLNPEWRLGE